MKNNPIIDFIQGGGDLLSKEGTDLILESSRDDIKTALQDNAAGAKLVIAMNGSKNQRFKQKILDACH